MYINKETAEAVGTGVLSKEELINLTNYIRENIPLMNYMQVKVNYLLDYSIKLTAPLEPNSNHYGSAFGGSISTLGIAAGWALLQSKISRENLNTRLVIQSSNSRFIRPAKESFEAVCSITTESWFQFKSKILTDNKAKIFLRSELFSENQIIAVQEGLYVALDPSK